MAENKIQITVEALNKFDATFKQLSGQIQGLGKEIGGINNLLSGFGSTMKSSLGALAGIGAAFTSFAGLKSLISGAVDSTQAYANEVYKLSRLTGLSTEASSEFIQVARRMGIETDTLTAGVSVLARRIGGLKDIEFQATDEAGKSVDVFKKFGIEIKNADGSVRSFSNVFEQIREKIRATQNPIEQLGIASQFFGRNAKEWIPILTLSKEKLAELAESAKKYGLILSGDNVQAIREYTLKHRELDQAISGLKLKIGQDLLPTFTDLTNAILKLVSDKETMKSWAWEIGSAFEILKNVLVSTGTAIEFLSSLIARAVGGPMASSLNGLIDQLDKIILYDKYFKDIELKFGTISKNTQVQAGQFDALNKRWAGPGESRPEKPAGAGGKKTDINQQLRDQIEVLKSLDEIQKKFAEVEKQANRFKDQGALPSLIEDFKRISFENIEKEILKLASAFADLDGELSNSPAMWDEAAMEAIKYADILPTEKVRELQKELEKLNEEFKSKNLEAGYGEYGAEDRRQISDTDIAMEPVKRETASKQQGVNRQILQLEYDAISEFNDNALDADRQRFEKRQQMLAMDHEETIRKLRDAGATELQIEKAKAAQEKQIAADTAAYQQSCIDKYASTTSTSLGNISQAFLNMYEMSGETAEGWFIAYKITAIAQVIVDTARAIMAGYAQLGPIGGTVTAVAMAALGATQIAMIAAQQPARNRHAEGGPVIGGSGYQDDVFLGVTPDGTRHYGMGGEFVEPKDSVRYYGMAFMEDVRKKRFPKTYTLAYNTGGLVPSYAGASQGFSGSVNIKNITPAKGGDFVFAPQITAMDGKDVIRVLRNNRSGLNKMFGQAVRDYHMGRAE